MSNGLISQFYFTGGTLQNSVGTSSLSLVEDGDGATFSADRDGNGSSALSFDGSAGNTQKLSIDYNYLDFDLTNDFSISFWFKTNDISASDLQILFSSRQDYSPGEKGGVDCYINTNGEFQVVYRNELSGAPIAGLNTLKTTAINAGIWYHVTIIKSGANVSHYINGSIKSSETISNFPSTNFPMVSYWNVGAFFNTQTGDIYRELDGGMDDIRLYNRVLTQQEVMDLYQETPPISTVSISETENKIISVFPNPVNSYLTIQTTEVIENISVVSALGATIEYVVAPNNIVDLSSLTAGVYFLQMKTSNGLMSKKFIKN
ncbi:MAG: T9SS type A sorting domain-containing protein [Vicingaceae bacterium]|nr:T9SS type A sorting domain-containing protein [Vicingaceae bacterium]